MSAFSFLSSFTEKRPDVKKLNLILMGHAAFQILNAGCELKIFEILHQIPDLTKQSINERLQLEERPLHCILLGLVALDLVVKNGDGYRNSDAIETMFRNDFWKIFYDTVIFENKVVYLGQYDFVESLKSNKNVGLRRVEGDGETLYHKFHHSVDMQSAFYNYMSSWSQMSIPLLIDTGLLSNFKKILDVGGGDATNAIEIARHNPKGKVSILELKENSIHAVRKIKAVGMEDRVSVIEGDMFKTDFGKEYDCVIFIHQLVIWSRDQVILLLKKAFDALSDKGSVVIYNSITANDGSGPLFGALDSVYFMSIPAEGGMIYSYKFYEDCLREAGFKKINSEKFETWSPHGVVIGEK